MSTAAQFLFMLPMPLSAPGLKARLGCIAVKRTDFALNQAGDNRLLRVKLPAYVLPNPIYLFKQELLPQLFEDGMSEYEFLNELEGLTAPEHVLPVVFGFKYLFYVDAAALRCLRLPSLFRGRDILDLKVVLQASRLFGALRDLHPEAAAALPAALKALGLSHQGTRLADRADMLCQLTGFLRARDSAIFNFCLKGRPERERRLMQSLTEGKAMVCCDGSRCALLRSLEFFGDKVRVVRCFTDYSLDVCTLDLNEPVLIAPSGILTEERQAHLNFNLEKAESLLNALIRDQKGLSELPDHSPADLVSALRHKLTEQEFELLFKLGLENPQLLPPAPLWTSAYFKEIYFLYQADNFRESLISAELERYAAYCRAQLASQIKLYVKEAEAAASLLPEDDEKASKLLYDIVNYVANL